MLPLTYKVTHMEFKQDLGLYCIYSLSYLFPLAMNHFYIYKIVFKNRLGDLPSGPVVKTLCSHTAGYRLDPWSGTKIPHATWPKHTHTHRVLTDCTFEYSYSQNMFKYFLIFII